MRMFDKITLKERTNASGNVVYDIYNDDDECIGVMSQAKLNFYLKYGGVLTSLATGGLMVMGALFATLVASRR